MEDHQRGMARQSHKGGDCRGDISRLGDQVAMFGDRHGNAGDIGLLEGVFAEHMATDLATDRQDGGGVHHRVGNRRDQVSHTRAGGADAARARARHGGRV